MPRNNAVKSGDSIPRNPLDQIPSASWYNSSFPVPSASSPRNSVCSHSRLVPRINKENTNGNKMSASATCSSLPPKKRRSRKGRIERHARERENRNSSFTHDARWANQRAAVPDVPAVPERVTQPLPETNDPTSAMRTAVYPPSRIVGDSPTNENSLFQIGLESSRFPGLYKPAVPDQQKDTWTNNLRARSSRKGPPSPSKDLRARSSGKGPPSPSKDLRARSSGTGPRSGIIYPLQPRGRRPDVCITVEAALPEPAALLLLTFPILRVLRSRRKLLQTSNKLPGDLVASAEETVLQRYSGQPNAHLHGGIGVTSQSPSYKQSKSDEYKQKQTVTKAINKLITVPVINKV